jgi:hypothetical protein
VGVTSLSDWRYSKLIEEAGERTRDTGFLDLCDLAEAAAQGFDTSAFSRDVFDIAFPDDNTPD